MESMRGLDHEHEGKFILIKYYKGVEGQIINSIYSDLPKYFRSGLVFEGKSKRYRVRLNILR